MTSPDSQQFESYVPVYDAIPDKWEDARPFIVEQLKKLANGINLREIGWYLDEELLSGKAFIPGAIPPGNSTPAQFRQILRKVIVFGPVIAGTNQIAHGINFDVNFTLIDLWVSATNSTLLLANTYSNAQNVAINANFIIFISLIAYDRAFAFVEYTQEL